MSSALEAELGYTFRDPDLLKIALTHRSFSNERGEKDNYERLEFLGDSVLGMVASRWLYDRYPEEPEGLLAKRKSFLVSSPVLARYAESIELGPHLHLGVGEARSGGSAKASILADAVEAVLGAVYLDGGLDAARVIIEEYLEDAQAKRSRLADADAKTRLQELAQARGWGLPDYRVAAESGPDHRKRFTIECAVEGEVVGTAEGGSKKVAEQRAAAAALEQLDLVGSET
ncbi:MAG: ribonuclease III [bacterium]|nr:ribonuclease III [bacterium]